MTVFQRQPPKIKDVSLLPESHARENKTLNYLPSLRLIVCMPRSLCRHIAISSGNAMMRRSAAEKASTFFDDSMQVVAARNLYMDERKGRIW